MPHWTYSSVFVSALQLILLPSVRGVIAQLQKIASERRCGARKSLLLRRGHVHRRLADFVVRFAFQTNPMPQLKIEQTPDAIVVIAMLRAMFVKQLLDRLAPEITAIQAARLKQHFANRFQPRTGQPTAPRRRKSQLWP